MRLHFISRLALLIAGTFLLVATQEGVWGSRTLGWMLIVGGAFTVAIAATDAVLLSLEHVGLDLLTAAIGAWMIAEALVLSADEIKWWTFGSAAAVAALSAVGLIVHERDTERAVHELRATRFEEARRRAMEPAKA